MEQCPDNEPVLLNVSEHRGRNFLNGMVVLCRLIAVQTLAEHINQLIFNLVFQIVGIRIVEIKRAAVEIRPFRNFLDGDILELLLIHEFGQRLTQQPLGPANSAVNSLFTHSQHSVFHHIAMVCIITHNFLDCNSPVKKICEIPAKSTADDEKCHRLFDFLSIL